MLGPEIDVLDPEVDELGSEVEVLGGTSIYMSVFHYFTNYKIIKTVKTHFANTS